MRSYAGEAIHRTCAEAWITAHPTESRLGRFASDLRAKAEATTTTLESLAGQGSLGEQTGHRGTPKARIRALQRCRGCPLGDRQSH